MADFWFVYILLALVGFVLERVLNKTIIINIDTNELLLFVFLSYFCQ